MITINMEKALKIKQEYVKAESIFYLAKVNTEYSAGIAQQDNAKVKDVAQRQQNLLDSVNDPVLLNAKTPEELKNAEPAAIAYEKNNLRNF